MKLSIPVAPTFAVAAAFLLGACGSSVYAAAGMTPSAAFFMCYFISVSWAFSWWALEDCRQLGIAPVHDYGWFLLQWWPIVIPYHLLKTRKVLGCAFAAGFVVLFLLAYVIAIAVYFLARAVLVSAP